MGLVNEADLPTMVAISGPVKNFFKAKAFLEQRVLIAVNDNFTYETLANILFTTALENKLPDYLSSTIKAVGFLILNKLTHNIATDLIEKITEKMSMSNQPIMEELKRECDFLKVASAEHSKLVLNISVAVDKLTSSSLNLVASNQSFTSTVKEMQPSIQVLSSATTHIQSLAKSVAAVAKSAKD